MIINIFMMVMLALIAAIHAIIAYAEIFNWEASAISKIRDGAP